MHQRVPPASSPFRPSLCALAVLIASALAAGCGDGEPRETASRTASPAASPARPTARPSVLILTIDTLRADHLGCYGYDPYDQPVSPAIDAFADEGVRVTRAFAPRGQTAPSLASMMLGQYPSTHGVRENGQKYVGERTTLFQRLNKLGYATRAFISRMPSNKEGSPTAGVDVMTDGRMREDGSMISDQSESDALIAGKVDAWLRNEAAGAGPFCAWVHFYDVHQPYAPHAPYDTMFSEGYDGKLLPPEDERPLGYLKIAKTIKRATLARKPLAPADHRFVVSLYDGGVRSTDAHVGTIMAALDAAGLRDDTIVILSADHGEELADRQVYYYHGNSIYDGTLRIPLIVRWPGHVPPGTVFDGLVQNVDFVPTLLDWMGEPIPDDLDGVSIASWFEEPGRAGLPPREEAFIEWQDLIYAVRTEDAKYVVNPFGVHPKKAPYYGGRPKGFQVECDEYYRLESDPGEQNNLAGALADDEVARALRESVLAFRSREGIVEGWGGDVDEKMLEELRELGYVGTDRDRSDSIFGAESCGNER